MDTAEMLALGGIAVPAAGGFVMYAWNLSTQRRKSARRVLFYYLEFWNFLGKQLQWMQPENITQEYLDEVNTYIARHYPDAGTMDSQSVKALVDALFSQLQATCNRVLDTVFIESYKVT